MERCEPPRAARADARRLRRLTDWQLREIVRVAGRVRAAGGRAVQLHGVVVLFRRPGRRRHGGWQQQRSAVVGDASTASSAKPEQLSKRKQRSSMRLADFRRRMEQRDQAAAAKLRRLWSVVWLQRLVRRRLVERLRLAAGVALVGEPSADAGLQKAKADASEECVAPEGNTATIRAGAVAAPKRKVGSGAEVPPAKAVARYAAASPQRFSSPQPISCVLPSSCGDGGGTSTSPVQVMVGSSKSSGGPPRRIPEQLYERHATARGGA